MQRNHSNNENQFINDIHQALAERSVTKLTVFREQNVQTYKSTVREWLRVNADHADWCGVDLKNFTLAHLAVGCGAVETFKMLREKRRGLYKRIINLPHDEEDTPFSLAVIFDEAEVVTWLLDNEVGLENWHPSTDPNENIAHLAAVYEAVAVFDILKEKRLHSLQQMISRRNNDSHTPFSLAIHFNRAKSVAWLLDNVENLDGIEHWALDERIISPVHWAVARGAIEALEVFKEKRTSLFYLLINLDDRGITPLKLAIENNRTQMVEFILANNIWVADLLDSARSFDTLESMLVMQRHYPAAFAAWAKSDSLRKAARKQKHKVTTWLIENKFCMGTISEINEVANYFQKKLNTLVDEGKTEDQTQREFKACFELMLSYLMQLDDSLLATMPPIFKNCRQMAMIFGEFRYADEMPSGRREFPLLEFTATVAEIDPESFPRALLSVYLEDPNNLVWKIYVAKVVAGLDLTNETEIEKIEREIKRHHSVSGALANMMAVGIYKKLNIIWPDISADFEGYYETILLDCFTAYAHSLELTFDRIRCIIKHIAVAAEVQASPQLSLEQVKSIFNLYFLVNVERSSSPGFFSSERREVKRARKTDAVIPAQAGIHPSLK